MGEAAEGGAEGGLEGLACGAAFDFVESVVGASAGVLAGRAVAGVPLGGESESVGLSCVVGLAGLSVLGVTLDFGGPEAGFLPGFIGWVLGDGSDGGSANSIGAVCSAAVGGGTWGVW